MRWFCAAALAGAAVFPAAPLAAGSDDARVLASELRIAAGDLERLKLDLPPAHLGGLRDRLAGSLGLLPWLLIRAGDADGAAALQDDPAVLPGLVTRYPLDLAAVDPASRPAANKREARLIHDTYCAGCHDGAGDGDPAAALPARDLFGMARAEAPDVFLARLINGIKGDETIGFRMPLSDAQLLALWAVYLGE